MNYKSNFKMKKLDLVQMESLQGGSPCGWAIFGLVSAFAGLCVTTTPVGGAIGVASMIGAGYGMGACN